MNNIAKIYLFVAAAFCGGIVAFLGISFSFGVEDYPLNFLDYIFWFVFGMVFVSPLFIPAVIPSRWPRALVFFRRVGAIYLLILLYLSFSAIFPNVGRLLRGWETSMQTLSISTVWALLCTGSLGILLWSDINRIKVLINRQSN
jgi:hypothetical protein